MSPTTAQRQTVQTNEFVQIGSSCTGGGMPPPYNTNPFA